MINEASGAARNGAPGDSPFRMATQTPEELDKFAALFIPAWEVNRPPTHGPDPGFTALPIDPGLVAAYAVAPVPVAIPSAAPFSPPAPAAPGDVGGVVGDLFGRASEPADLAALVPAGNVAIGAFPVVAEHAISGPVMDDASPPLRPLAATMMAIVPDNIALPRPPVVLPDSAPVLAPSPSGIRAPAEIPNVTFPRVEASRAFAPMPPTVDTSGEFEPQFKPKRPPLPLLVGGAALVLAVVLFFALRGDATKAPAPTEGTSLMDSSSVQSAPLPAPIPPPTALAPVQPQPPAPRAHPGEPRAAAPEPKPVEPRAAAEPKAPSASKPPAHAAPPAAVPPPPAAPPPPKKAAPPKIKDEF